MPAWFLGLAAASVLAYGLLAGVFLAFSDFIMRALARTGGSGGLEAMQVINREVFRIVFMALFLGMVLLSALLAVYGLSAGDMPGARAIALGGGVYLVGAFAVTVAGNVPLNETLARLAPTDPAAMAYWRETYLPRWTAWNGVRTAACLVAAALTLAGLLAAARA